MNSTNYKQYDSRWGNLPYPSRPWTIANSGCGEVAICNIIIEMAKYKNETPKTIQPYCVQYAAPGGDGTYWSGIPAMMKHYGLTEVKEHDTMPELFAELAKGGRVAVYLMGSRPAGNKGVHWTSGGHFVSSVAYKKEGGEDWVYMKDPNSTSSLRNGWITYNGNIRGACLKVWSGKLTGSPTPSPSPKPSKKGYTGRYPDVHVKRDAAHVVGNAVNFGKWIAGDNDFHYGFGDHAHHNGCYFCGTNGAKKGHMKMWEHTYCCNPFVHACFAHGGLVPSMLKMCQQGRSYGFKKGEGYDASNLFKKINRADAKAGDVFCSDCHVALYIGNGKIVHAGSEDDNVIHSASWNKSITIGEWKDKYYDPPRVYRFIGSVDADIVIRKGEVSGRVKDLQNYLVWYGALPKGEKADGYYGEKTYKAVVKMQTDFFGAKEADGLVGPKTIAKMKTVRK